MTWLHDRFPAILSNSDEIGKWLNPDMDCDEALQMLHNQGTPQVLIHY